MKEDHNPYVFFDWGRVREDVRRLLAGEPTIEQERKQREEERVRAKLQKQIEEQQKTLQGFVEGAP